MDLIEKQNKKGDKKIIPARRFPDFANDGEWEEAAFENTFLFLPNNTLSRAELNYENGSTKNLHYGDVLIKFGDCLDVQTNVLPFISDEAIADRLQRSRLQDGDVIIADTAEDETVGKCTEIFNVSGENVVSGLHTIPIRPKKQFAIPYLGFYFNSDSYRKQLLPLMQGVKVMSISKAAIGKTIVAYPSLLTEQCIIGSCLSSMDAYISATKEKLELLKTYKKGLMQKLFPAKGKKLPELRFKEFEKDGEWEVKKLEEIVNVLDSQRKPVAKNERVRGQYPYYGANGIQDYVSDYIFDGSFILMGEDGSVINKDGTPVIHWAEGQIWVNNHAHVMSENRNAAYLKYVFYVLSNVEVQSLVKGIPPKINQQNMRNILLLIPSLLEQEKIASCLSTLDEKINAYKEKVTLLGQYKKGLMQQLFPTSK